MKNITPYLKALKAFESTARLGSFSEAGKELFVTSAAVGQLVKQLEHQLNIPLFHRQKGGVQRLQLTEQAKNALPDIQAGFEHLTQGLTKLQQKQHNHLTVTISPALASKWLLPRLTDFQIRYPEISLRLHTDIRPLDFLADDIDIGIRYGYGDWAELVSEKLFDEEIFPVCSPKWLERYPIQHPLELASEMFIHDVSLDSQSGFVSWQHWLNNADVPVQLSKQGLQINNSAAVLQAAIDGQGVALARSVLVKDDVASGRLIRLFPHIRYKSPLAYYVVYPHLYQHQEKIQCFKAWLFAMMA